LRRIRCAAKAVQSSGARVGDRTGWDPITSTLIFGARDAVLAGSLMTVREAAALVSPIAGGV
jgi:hypothetical protein